MKNLAFIPMAIHAKVGQTVKWTNDDTPAHNVTYVSGPKFTSSGTMNTGATVLDQGHAGGDDSLLLLDPPVHEGDDRRDPMSATADPAIFKAYDIRGLYGEQIDAEVARGDRAGVRAGDRRPRGQADRTSCGSASATTCA